MWTRLSLRARLFLPLGIMFVTALLVATVSLAFFVPTQLVDETAPGAGSAKAVAAALNGGLRISANPEQTLDAFVKSLGTSEAIQFRRDGVKSPRHPVEVQTPLGRVPRWFVDLLAVPEICAAFPVMIDENRVGEIIFSPDIFRRYVRKMGRLCRHRLLHHRADIADRDHRLFHRRRNARTDAQYRRGHDPDAQGRL
jgi:two-component system sensor histidine kinase UhpB